MCIRVTLYIHLPLLAHTAVVTAVATQIFFTIQTERCEYSHQERQIIRICTYMYVYIYLPLYLHCQNFSYALHFISSVFEVFPPGLMKQTMLEIPFPAECVHVHFPLFCRVPLHLLLLFGHSDTSHIHSCF